MTKIISDSTKNIFKFGTFLLCLMVFISCNSDEETSQDTIRFGVEDHDTIAINKLSTRIILLRGGTGKYTANVADSRYASVSISRDTLRISGILEGETFANIISGDFSRRIKINVVVPELSISDTEIRLFPRDESKFISLNGGGDIAELKVEDPDKVISTKWNARTNILEIEAFYEGEALVRVLSQDGKEKTLKVVVRCNGTADRVGIYSTTSRSIYRQMNTLMSIRRPGVGVWLSNSTRPSSARRFVKITPEITNPQQGSRIDVRLSMTYPDEFRNTNLSEGTHSLYVEEVREKDVVLRGRGFKLVVPYEK